MLSEKQIKGRFLKEQKKRDERLGVEQQGPQSYVSRVTFSLGPSRNGVAERQKIMEIISQR